VRGLRRGLLPPVDFEIGKGYGLSSALGGETRDGVVACGKLHRVTSPSERLVFVDIEERANPCFWPVVQEKDLRTLRLIKGLETSAEKASSDNSDLDLLVTILTRPFPPEG
jgi:hypothetical protein